MEMVLAAVTLQQCQHLVALMSVMKTGLVAGEGKDIRE